MRYKLTLYYAGKDASVFVDGTIDEIIPIGKYTKFDLVVEESTSSPP